MRFLLTLLFLSLAQVGWCCVCIPKMPFKNEADLKEYAFIARVKITKLPPFNKQFSNWRLRADSTVGIEVKELFKGQITNVVYDDAYKSDCALHLSVGEEWLFFVTQWKGHLSVSLCSYTVRYRDSLGKREWEYDSGLKELDALRRIYTRPLTSNVNSFQYYENVKIEVEQKLSGRKLNGERRIYYPNGKLFIVEQFKKDVRVGARLVYRPSGQLSSRTEYKNGLKKKEENYLDTTYYNSYFLEMAKRPKDWLFADKNPKHDSLYYINLRDLLMHLSDWGKRVSSYYVFSDDGHSYASKVYGYMGNVERESNFNWPKQVVESREYYADGKLRYYTRYDHLKDTYLEDDYFENGKERHVNRKCDCDLYFNALALPAATPAKGYIQ